MTEKPLVTWKVIADHLDVSIPTARKTLKGCHMVQIGQRVGIYPSDLKAWLKRRG